MEKDMEMFTADLSSIAAVVQSRHHGPDKISEEDIS